MQLEEKLYRGVYTPDGRTSIIVESAKGSNKNYQLRHSASPAGFSWGNTGAGATETALCVLADALGEDTGSDKLTVSKILHTQFRDDVVYRFCKDGEWVLYGFDVKDWLDARTRTCPVCGGVYSEGSDKYPVCEYCQGKGIVASGAEEAEKGGLDWKKEESATKSF